MGIFLTENYKHYNFSLQPQPQVQPQPSETSKIDLKTPSFIPVENLEATQQPPTPSTPGAAVPNHDETPVFAASCNIEPDSLDPDINNENNGLNGEDPKPGIFLLLFKGMGAGCAGCTTVQLIFHNFFYQLFKENLFF